MISPVLAMVVLCLVWICVEVSFGVVTYVPRGRRAPWFYGLALLAGLTGSVILVHQIFGIDWTAFFVAMVVVLLIGLAGGRA